jgi:hypothetical protein
MPEVFCEECYKHCFFASHPGIALSIWPECICGSNRTFSLPMQTVVQFHKTYYYVLAKNIMKILLDPSARDVKFVILFIFLYSRYSDQATGRTG